VNEGDMTRQRPLGMIMKFWERNHFSREGLYFLVWIFFWLGVWEDSCRSAPGCWEFWAQGPGILELRSQIGCS
jgi:hypothetical protein